MTTYEATADPDIFEEVSEVRTTISLSELEVERDAVQETHDVLPDEKTKPDQETLEFYNMHHSYAEYKDQLQTEIDDKDALINTLKALAAVADPKEL